MGFIDNLVVGDGKIKDLRRHPLVATHTLLDHEIDDNDSNERSQSCGWS